METTLNQHTSQITSTYKQKRHTKHYNFDILAEEYYNLHEMLKKLKDQEDELKKRLDTYVSELETKSYVSKKFIYSSYERKGNIDYTVIPQLKKVNLEQFRKAATICWKLTKI